MPPSTPALVCDPTRPRRARDHGSVDVSIEMLFGMISLIIVMLVMFEAVAYWHARNVYDEAAAEGVRIAAAYDGSCLDGIAAATDAVRRHAGGWATDVEVTCTERPGLTGIDVTVVVRGGTPGVIGGPVGFTAAVAESAPKES